MYNITGIDPKALQLTGILLQQYAPKLIPELPNLQELSSKVTSGIAVELPPEQVGSIIQALNKIGEQWLEEKDPRQADRDKQRQSCLAFLLNEWIEVCERCQNQMNNQLH